MRNLAIVMLPALLACPVAANAGGPTLGVPKTNPVPPSGLPVEVESCKLGERGHNLLIAKTGLLEILFTNEGTVTADVVRYDRTKDGYLMRRRRNDRFELPLVILR